MKQLLLSTVIAAASATFAVAQDAPQNAPVTTLPDMPGTDTEVSPDIAPEPLESEGADDREDREDAAKDDEPSEETPR